MFRPLSAGLYKLIFSSRTLGDARKKATCLTTLLLVACLTLPLPALALHDQIVAGAGPSTEAAELFFKHFSQTPACEGYRFAVMAWSITHKGGILSSDKYLFGRTGRPLSAGEKSLGKSEIPLGRVPIAFAVGLEAEADVITLTELRQIMTRVVTNWKQIGGNDAPILLVGREQNDALLSILQRKYPFFKTVKFDKEITQDHKVVKFINSPAGANAITFGVKPDFQLYNLLPVEGFSADVTLGLVYDNKNADHPVVKAAIKYAQSAEWKTRLKELDMRPVDE